MTSTFTELAIDCADPVRLADFWCTVLGYAVLEQDDEIVSIGPAPTDTPAQPARSGPIAPTLTFARVPEEKSIKNRVHLDLSPADRDQDAEVARLLALGAQRVDVGQTGEESWVCLADPEGNEFCVLAGRD